MKVGDVVIIKDENRTRNHWPLSIVDEVFPSSDGRIRKLKLHTTNNELDKKGRPFKSPLFAYTITAMWRMRFC